MRVLRYDAVPALCASDHKPVYAVVDVRYDSSGAFDDENRPALKPHRPKFARGGTSAPKEFAAAMSGELSARGSTSNAGKQAQSSVCSVM